MPMSEVEPMARGVSGVENQRLPVAVRAASPSLLRVFGDDRTKGRRFVVQQSYNEEVFIEVIRQAHQNVFGMIEIDTFVKFVIVRMPSAVNEDWTEGKTLLRR